MGEERRVEVEPEAAVLGPVGPPGEVLRPDLVPRFVKLVAETGKRLGFQILMISHHDVSAFEDLADRIYRLSPGESGVRVAV